MLRSSRRRWASDGATDQYWLSYADLLAGLLMVFALLLLTAFHTYQNRARSIQDLVETRQAITDSLLLRFEGRPFVKVDPMTGSVRFGSDVLFDLDSSELLPDGRTGLRAFAADYLPVVLGVPQFSDHLEEIVIEGHTDPDGPFPLSQVDDNYMYNLRLSQDRASSAMQFILGQADEYEDELRRYVTANGRSSSDPVFERDSTTVDKDASRRIEVRFRLNDEHVVQEILERLFFRSGEQ